MASPLVDSSTPCTCAQSITVHVLPAAGYCDGASHQRKDFYRQSPFDSSIFLLQTTAAAKKWPVSEQLLKDLQVAFAACCPSAAAAERQKKRRGARDLEAKGYGVPVQKGPDAAGIAPRGSGKGGSRST
jgi:hypothetical protein